MNYYPKFANQLNKYLQERDRSASWLARRVQVHPVTVSRWRNGETRPRNPELLIRIAEVLGIYDSSERQKFLISAGYGYQKIVQTNTSRPKFMDLLNKYLTEQERTASWLAQRLDLHHSTVGRWLKNDKYPGSPEMVMQIADVLGIENPREREMLLHAADYGYEEVGNSNRNLNQIWESDNNSTKNQLEIIIQGEFSDLTSELKSAAIGALAGILNIPRQQIHLKIPHSN